MLPATLQSAMSAPGQAAAQFDPNALLAAFSQPGQSAGAGLDPSLFQALSGGAAGGYDPMAMYASAYQPMQQYPQSYGSPLSAYTNNPGYAPFNPVGLKGGYGGYQQPIYGGGYGQQPSYGGGYQGGYTLPHQPAPAPNMYLQFVNPYGGGYGGGQYGGGYGQQPSYGGYQQPSYGGGYGQQPSYGGGYGQQPSYGGGGYAPVVNYGDYNRLIAQTTQTNVVPQNYGLSANTTTSWYPTY